MKRTLYVPMLLSVLSAGVFSVTSCSNTGKKAQETAETAAADAQQLYQQQVHRFDSSWTERLAILDSRIAQWDSSAKTYKSSLRDRMEKQIDKVKVQRDSLKNTLGQAGDQAQEGWSDFQQSVSSQYADIVQSLKDLGSMNQ